ncbi:MAG: iron complex outermembrane receptor protein [Bermanella sp.]|jgi:iron complex outermembrane receptor protein
MAFSHNFVLSAALLITSEFLLAEKLADKSSERRAVLEEVVVTAQKRSESVQDVPIAISVFSADKLKGSKIENFEDIALAAPNLDINMTPGYVQIGMRGLNAPINDGMEQSVGFYVDGIYYGKAAFLQDAFLDIGRVEILRGPQGTLFGKNTIAGAISVTTARPQQEQRIEGSISGGSFSGRKLSLMVNTPLVDDKLALRIAAISEHRDGYIDNPVRDEAEKQVDKTGLRLKLLFEPSEQFELIFSLYGGEAKDNGQGWEPFLLTDNARTAHGANNPELEDKANYVGHANTDNFNDSKTLSATLETNWVLGEHTLTTVAGYGRLDENFLLDGDTASADIVFWLNRDDYEQRMLELRLVSPPGDLEYIAGIFAFESDYLARSELRAFPDADTVEVYATGSEVAGAPPALTRILSSLMSEVDGLSDLLGVDGLLQGVITDALFQTFDQHTATYAAFGQVSWRPIAPLALILGLRASEEEKVVDLTQEYASTGLVLQQAFGVQRYRLRDASRKESNFAPKYSVKYDLLDELMLYVSRGEGFKAGGFNPLARVPEESKFDQEYSRSYELGAKWTALSGAATLNVTAFNTTFEDMQIQSFIGNGFLVRNAAESTTQGLEVEANWAPALGSVIYTSGGWTDTRIDHFLDGPCPEGDERETCDLAGSPLPRAPEYSFNTGFNTVLPLFESGTALIVGGDAAWRSEILFDLDQDPLDAESAYWLFHARMGIADIAERWSVIVHAKNLGDKKIKQFSADLPLFSGAHMGFLIPPRMISVEINLNF